MSDVLPPLNVTQLGDRLVRIAGELGVPVARARVMLCTLIVSQMLPDAVAVKGGMGVKLRFGERGTRATADLDVSTRARGEAFEQEFRRRLAEGWGTVPPSKGEQRRNPAAADRVAFTATVRAVKIHTGFRSRSSAVPGVDWTSRSPIPRSTRTPTRVRSMANSSDSAPPWASAHCNR